MPSKSHKKGDARLPRRRARAAVARDLPDLSRTIFEPLEGTRAITDEGLSSVYGSSSIEFAQGVNIGVGPPVEPDRSDPAKLKQIVLCDEKVWAEALRTSEYPEIKDRTSTHLQNQRLIIGI